MWRGELVMRLWQSIVTVQRRTYETLVQWKSVYKYTLGEIYTLNEHVVTNPSSESCDDPRVPCTAEPGEKDLNPGFRTVIE